MAADESNDNLISVANGLISGSSRHLTNAWFQLQDASALFFAIFFLLRKLEGLSPLQWNFIETVEQ